jgi:hypothetical protein
VTPLSIVLVDTMTFAYLQALGQLEVLRRLAAETHRLAVTKAVLRELLRSRRLGPLVQSYCDRQELVLLSPCVDDVVSTIVSGTLGTPRSMLIRRHRVDGELIEAAAFHDGAVLSSERGIQELARLREVPTLDLLVFFAWAVQMGVLTPADAAAVTAPWRAEASPVTGAPSDFRGGYGDTVQRRGARLVDLLAALTT